MVGLLNSTPKLLLAIAIPLQLAGYLYLNHLSRVFEFHAPTVERPLLIVIGILTANFLVHLVALAAALKLTDSKTLAMSIVLGALAFRGALITSVPIQEVDIYRYIWDGAVVRTGVSPFAYSPKRVLEASRDEPGISPELQSLIELRDNDSGLYEVLQRVHYGELTTIYPPVSQVVFSLGDRLAPPGSEVGARVLAMKFVIVAFDIGVVLLLAGLLRILKVHRGWLISYAWSPLVLKEFANSGHLDSIAVCFCIVALYSYVRLHSNRLVESGNAQASTDHSADDRSLFWLPGALLGLGVGAKLFPIVLLPLLVVHAFYSRGFGRALSLLGMTCLVSTISLSTMFWGIRNPPDDQLAAVQQQALPPPPALTDAAGATSADDGGLAVGKPKSDDGLSTFLSRWEMNDLLFMVVEENIRPTAPALPGLKPPVQPWFVILPNAWRTDVNNWAAATFEIPANRMPFIATRVVTLCVFLLLIGTWTCRVAVSRSEIVLMESCFLALAWFWFLAPTQNPWYWSWALPLIAFARSRVWLWVGGFSMLYYARFWLLYHYSQPDAFGSGLTGTQFFDFVIVWFEFGPILFFLLVGSFWHFVASKRQPA